MALPADLDPVIMADASCQVAAGDGRDSIEVDTSWQDGHATPVIGLHPCTDPLQSSLNAVIAIVCNMSGVMSRNVKQLRASEPLSGRILARQMSGDQV